MPDFPGWLASYGQLGAIVWLAFEIRDLRRFLNLHIQHHHPEVVDKKAAKA